LTVEDTRLTFQKPDSPSKAWNTAYIWTAIVTSLIVGAITITSSGNTLIFENVTTVDFNNSNLTNIYDLDIGHNLSVGNNAVIDENLSVKNCSWYENSSAMILSCAGLDICLGNCT